MGGKGSMSLSVLPAWLTKACLALWRDWSFMMSPLPAKHLASLASCVTGYLWIVNVSGCDLVSLLTSLKCEALHISRQSLGREETHALVQAMESGVEKVMLGGEVTLDIGALTKYSGQGVCRAV